jgi:serine/threonine-protein kinase HipA
MRPGERVATFQYWPEFVHRGLEISPISMRLSTNPYIFPALDRTSFHGLPGLVADSLPDRFGNTLLAAALRVQGRSLQELDPVARLSYLGNRGMGALEFLPATGPENSKQERLQVEDMLNVVGQVLQEKAAFATRLTPGQEEKALLEILQIGSTAGGARAKAVINFDPQSLEVRSGHQDPAPGFEPWILKLDGVPDDDMPLGRGSGVGRLEYAYHLMAAACGLQMSECRLLEEEDRAHFMTRRFDRTEGGKIHMQTLGSLLHLDYSGSQVLAYERALEVLARLNIGKASQEELFRRLVFNVVCRNQDDHVKNLCVLMDPSGRWSLGPAYDLTWAPLEEPEGQRMSVNGKLLGITLADFKEVAERAGFVRGRYLALVDQVLEGVRSWPDAAKRAGVPEPLASTVAASFRTEEIKRG